MMSSSTLIYKEFFGPQNPELPIEITFMVLQLLDIKDIGSSLLVNKLWNGLANDNSLWRDKFKQHFSDFYASKEKEENVIWKEEVKKASTPIERLRGSLAAFINEKNQSFHSEDMQELTAAENLQSVIFNQGRVTLLDRFHRYYQFGQVAAFYRDAKHLGLIPDQDNKMEIDDNDDAYYSRRNYDN